MAIQDMSAADLAAVMGNDNGFGGNNGWWIILLFLFLGWGGNGLNGANVGGDILYPWLNSSEALMNGFSNAETAASARQMATTQQLFDLSQQLSQACCDNRLATANLSADIAREACATRQAINEGVRDIIDGQTAGIQRILDMMCQNQLDAKIDEIQQLRSQIGALNLTASQTAQTAQIISALKPATTA